MWDSIFVLIHHMTEPYKKKDLHYLIDSRLQNDKKNSVILTHDIKVSNKCPDCKKFKPWIILKNCGEGLFLLNKIMGKFEPWITIALQQNFYELDYRNKSNFEFIFLLINKINSRSKLYGLISKNSESIIDSDIRIKNQCLNCHDFYPWIIIKNSKKGFELAQQLYDNSKPFITLKKHKIIYKHNIPEVFKRWDKWTWKEEMRYGKLKI